MNKRIMAIVREPSNGGKSAQPKGCTPAQALERIAEMALVFGPFVAIDAPLGAVFVDITGSERLLGNEQQIAKECQRRVDRLGVRCRIAIGEGPWRAAAFARYLAIQTPIAVAPEQSRDTFFALPMGALGLSDEAVQWLSSLGLRTVRDLANLPREQLATRLWGEAQRVLQRLDGKDDVLVSWISPPLVVEESVELEQATDSIEVLLFLLKTLIDRMCLRIEGRKKDVRNMEIAFNLDDREKSVERIPFSFSIPMGDASDLLRAVKTRLEPLQLRAHVTSLTLRATDFAEHQTRQHHLFLRESKVERALPRLLAELDAELGAGHVGILALIPTWLALRRSKLVAVTHLPSGQRDPVDDAWTMMDVEPLRIASHPFAFMEPHMSSVQKPLFRLERVDWWRRGFSREDHVAIWVGDAWAWIECSEGERRLADEFTPPRQMRWLGWLE